MTMDPSRMFRALSDPLRLRILHLLVDGEICVGDLVAILGVPQPTTSRHLRYLRSAGLVTVQARGRWKIYALAPGASVLHIKLLECVENCVAAMPEFDADRARANELRVAGGCCSDPPAGANACDADRTAPPEKVRQGSGGA